MCLIVVLTVVAPPAVQCSAQQRQRHYIVDLPLPMRPRESTNDCERSSSTWSAGSHMVVLCFFNASKFSCCASSSSSLPEATRSATCSHGEGAFVRRARHAVVRTQRHFHFDLAIRATVHMMVQICIFVYESSPQTASRQVLPTTTHAIFTFYSDLHPCLAVGRTGPCMEFDAHLRITEMFFRSSSSHDRRMHHGKVLVRKASSEVKERARESERERERARERSS